MTVETIVMNIISILAGGVVTLLTTWLLDWRKEKRANRLEAQKLRREEVRTRPEMQIVDFKDYLMRTGYGIKQKCDIELFVALIENVIVDGTKKRDSVHAYYNEEHLNPDEWHCVIYTFKNVGKTDVSTMDIVWNFQQSSCIFPVTEVRAWAEGNLLNYSYCYDKKIRVGDTVSLKVCYHKNGTEPGNFSATVSLGMIDDNGRYWTQPLFAPLNKIYDSRSISPDEYLEKTNTRTAEECFKHPWLW